MLLVREKRAFSRRSTVRTAALGLILIAGCAGADPTEEPRAPLRVGTTGNALPYSQEAGGTFVGSDIDLARDLGASLGRSVEFVPVAWPSLLSDLVDGRFDLAMGGIYVTPERGQVGVFSDPYLLVGQQAVVRCNEVARFRTLSDANRLGVKVLSTLGGTTHEFIQDNLAQATFVPVDPDPRQMMERIAEGQGDICFATSLGARYFTSHDNRLCIGLGGVEINEDIAIAILMPRGSPYVDAVNNWVRARTRDGLVEETVQAHMRD